MRRSRAFSPVLLLRVINTARPSESIRLLKTVAGGGPHGGGTFWTDSSADYRALVRWIAEGALQD